MRTTAVTLARWARRGVWCLGLLAVLYLVADRVLANEAKPVSDTSAPATSALRDAASVPQSETSSAAVQRGTQAEPTYVSELAPAVALPPSDVAALPATGTAAQGGSPIPLIAGLALALLGGAFIYAALALRPDES